MYQLNVEKRDKNITAKKLKKSGLVPCNLNTGEEGTSLLFTLPESEARKLLKMKAKGALVELCCEGETFQTVIKGVNYNGMANRVDDITFLQLHEGQELATVAKVILKNKDKVAAILQMFMSEIPYRATPEHIVETVEIDLGVMKPGDTVRIKDLSIAGEPVSLTVSEEKEVLRIASPRRKQESAVSE